MLAAGGALVASCASGTQPRATPAKAPLDELLAAHADALPEVAGAGANHDPMAAEALEALGHPEAIEGARSAGAQGCAGAPPRVAPIDDPDAALGDWACYGDWLELFRGEIAREPWRAVLARWTPRLAPGVSAAVFHGLIRTAHAVRALHSRETPERRGELAVGLAYWAARYTPLAPAPDAPELSTPLSALSNRWVDEDGDLDFGRVHARLERAPVASAVGPTDLAAPALEQIERTVREAAGVFLEMLVLERQRIWLLHTITGPAAAALLVPELAPKDARALATYARQASAALVVAFGAPCTPGTHMRKNTSTWNELTARAAASRSVHTIKLVEALSRFRAVDDALCRSVAAQWFEWV
ncbi:MAG TPA: hypothetical protein VMT18_14885 [Planctomycetota bacterium]|nr:hypothetical protein [Planctomycetota bacterium]